MKKMLIALLTLTTSAQALDSLTCHNVHFSDEGRLRILTLKAQGPEGKGHIQLTGLQGSRLRTLAHFPILLHPDSPVDVSASGETFEVFHLQDAAGYRQTLIAKLRLEEGRGTLTAPDDQTYWVKCSGRLRL